MLCDYLHPVGFLAVGGVDLEGHGDLHVAVDILAGDVQVTPAAGAEETSKSH